MKKTALSLVLMVQVLTAQNWGSLATLAIHSDNNNRGRSFSENQAVLTPEFTLYHNTLPFYIDFWTAVGLAENPSLEADLSTGYDLGSGDTFTLAGDLAYKRFNILNTPYESGALTLSYFHYGWVTLGGELSFDLLQSYGYAAMSCGVQIDYILPWSISVITGAPLSQPRDFKLPDYYGGLAVSGYLQLGPVSFEPFMNGTIAHQSDGNLLPAASVSAAFGYEF